MNLPDWFDVRTVLVSSLTGEWISSTEMSVRVAKIDDSGFVEWYGVPVINGVGIDEILSTKSTLVTVMAYHERVVVLNNEHVFDRRFIDMVTSGPDGHRRDVSWRVVMRLPVGDTVPIGVVVASQDGEDMAIVAGIRCNLADACAGTLGRKVDICKVCSGAGVTRCQTCEENRTCKACKGLGRVSC